jgi:pimeloyl-ACP methyl ester carboxylesterase
MKPLIHFAHANGIPSAVYGKLLDQLRDDYDVVTLPLIGTDPKFPVTNHWPKLVDQVIDSIERQAQGRPVIALGHSLGSLLSFMAAYRRPELMQMVIMLDPPLINGYYSLGLHLAKNFYPPFVDQITPAGISEKRRDHWPSREDAAQRLRGRGFFAHFDQACFDAYIQHGLTDAPEGGVTLTIPKAVEVAIFRNNPSWWWLTPRRPPNVPARLIVGQDSLFYQRGFPQRVERQLSVPFTLTKGGHMFPLERPVEVAALVKQVITQMQRC